MREKIVFALFVRESIVVPYYSQSFVLFLRLFGVFLLYFHFGPRGKNGQRNQTDLPISTLQQRPKVKWRGREQRPEGSRREGRSPGLGSEVDPLHIQLFS